VRLVGVGTTRDLVYSGRQVEAAEAVALRLAERVIPADHVLETAVADARGFARGPREALAAAKAAINTARTMSGPAGIRNERELFLKLFGSADQREGMHAFLEKREPRFSS
jgi:enoyl-CoA hydratase/carnithine racemase